MSNNNLEKYIEIINTLTTEDQKLREKVSKEGGNKALFDEMRNLDLKSTEELKKIVVEIGLPTISKVGKQASFNAWLLVQHSPDFDFQKEYLNLLKQNINDVEKKNIAYLEDRVLMYEKKPQLYGTQMTKNPNTGKFELYEVVDPMELDKRRNNYGLEPIEDYLKKFQ